MKSYVRELEPIAAPVAVPDEVPIEQTSVASASALAQVSAAQRRVELAKARITQRLAALEGRARSIAGQSVWVASVLVVGLVGMAAAGMAARSRRRRAIDDAMHVVTRPRLGSVLLLGALGLISRRLRHLEPRLPL